MLAKITGYVNVTSGNITALKAAIYKHGPVAVSIDASHKTFSFYSNGIYYEPKCGETSSTGAWEVLDNQGDARAPRSHIFGQGRGGGDEP